jgi:hypothetical protein
MKIAYTVHDGQIEINTLDLHQKEREFVRIFKNCLPVISFFHIKGQIQNRSYSIFSGAQEKGIILSVQIIPHNRRFEFESESTICVNFAPAIRSIHLIAADMPFKYSYDCGMINRFDVYIPAAKIDGLVPEKLLDQLYRLKMLNLSSTANLSSKANISLNKILKELEKPASKSLCTHIEKFIQSVTI